MEFNIFPEQTPPFRRNTHYSSGLFSLIFPCLLQNGFPKLALVFAPLILGNSVIMPFRLEAATYSASLLGKVLVTYKRIGITFLFANTNHYAILILPAWSSLF